jgi:hypothetical protein
MLERVVKMPGSLPPDVLVWPSRMVAAAWTPPPCLKEEKEKRCRAPCMGVTRGGSSCDAIKLAGLLVGSSRLPAAPAGELRSGAVSLLSLDADAPDMCRRSVR